MANTKVLKYAGKSGLSIECQVFHIAADGTVTQLDYNDGTFSASPVTPKVPLTEFGSTGLYLCTENRSAWADGNFVKIDNIVGVSQPDSAVEFEMLGDVEVSSNAIKAKTDLIPASPATEANVTSIKSSTINANIVQVIGDPIKANSSKQTQWGGT